MAITFLKAKAAHIRLGRLGEDCAVRLLRAKNFTILTRNWRGRGGELDIVALDGDILVFVEVKTRRKMTVYRPEANLTPGQKNRIRRGAAAYGSEIDHPPLPVRLDLVEVIHDGRRLRDIRHHCAYMAMTAER